MCVLMVWGVATCQRYLCLYRQILGRVTDSTIMLFFIEVLVLVLSQFSLRISYHVLKLLLNSGRLMAYGLVSSH